MGAGEPLPPTEQAGEGSSRAGLTGQKALQLCTLEGNLPWPRPLGPGTLTLVSTMKRNVTIQVTVPACESHTARGKEAPS